MLFNKVDENGIYIDLYKLDGPPMIKIDNTLVPDDSFILEPIPNSVYAELGISPKWTGTEWVATTERPEPLPQPPTDIEKLEAKINAATEYTDFLEEVIVEMAQVVFS